MFKKNFRIKTILMPIIVVSLDLFWLVISQIISYLIFFNKILSFYHIILNTFFIFTVLIPILRIYRLYGYFVKKNILSLVEKSLLAYGAFFVIFSTIVYFMNQNEFKLKFIWLLTLTVFLMFMSIIPRVVIFILIKFKNKKYLKKTKNIVL